MKSVDVKVIDPRLQQADAGLMLQYATSGSSGLDLRACIDTSLTLHPGATALIPTGIAIHLGDPGLAAMILPR